MSYISSMTVTCYALWIIEDVHYGRHIIIQYSMSVVMAIDYAFIGSRVLGVVSSNLALVQNAVESKVHGCTSRKTSDGLVGEPPGD